MAPEQDAEKWVAFFRVNQSIIRSNTARNKFEYQSEYEFAD
jgi:hypothetical protein